MSWIYIFILSMIATTFGPWWLVVVVSALIGFYSTINGKNAFWSGFFGVGLLWLIASLTIYIKNDGLLAGRVAGIFGLPEGWMLIVLSTLLGALIAGLACWSGFLIKRMIAERVSKPEIL